MSCPIHLTFNMLTMAIMIFSISLIFYVAARGHTRSGSHGSSSIVLEPELHHAATAPGQLADQAGSDQENNNRNIQHSQSWAPGKPQAQPEGIPTNVPGIVLYCVF